MYTYKPGKIVDLDETVRVGIKVQQRAERATVKVLQEAAHRIARSQSRLDTRTMAPVPSTVQPAPHDGV